MVTHRVGELVLLAFTVYNKPIKILGVIKKIDSGFEIGTQTCCVEWFDGAEQWYTSEGIEEMKSDLWSYLEAQNR